MVANGTTHHFVILTKTIASTPLVCWFVRLLVLFVCLFAYFLAHCVANSEQTCEHTRAHDHTHIKCVLTFLRRLFSTTARCKKKSALSFVSFVSWPFTVSIMFAINEEHKHIFVFFFPFANSLSLSRSLVLYPCSRHARTHANNSYICDQSPEFTDTDATNEHRHRHLSTTSPPSPPSQLELSTSFKCVTAFLCSFLLSFFLSLLLSIAFY